LRRFDLKGSEAAGSTGSDVPIAMLKSADFMESQSWIASHAYEKSSSAKIPFAHAFKLSLSHSPRHASSTPSSAASNLLLSSARKLGL